MFICELKNFLCSVWEFYLENDCTLTREQLFRLSNHRYSSTDSSWLDEFCMKRFWNIIVNLYPLWLAPNTITFLGFVINLTTVLILSSYCYSSTEEAPSWAYLLSAMGLFLYQTLDATDGKQARRTNSSTHLGEIFDHGLFIMLNVCHALQLGDVPYAVFGMIMGGIIVFYCAHWATYCSGQLKFSKFDVTEAQISIILVLIATGLFGPQIWNVSFIGIRLKILIIIGSFLLVSWQIEGYMLSVFWEGAGKNGSTIAETSVISPLFPILAICLSFSYIYFGAKSDMFDQNITLFAICLGGVSTKATHRLIISHMTQSPLPQFDSIALCPIMFFINRYYRWEFNEFVVLIIATIYAYANLLFFCHRMCEQLSRPFGISVFSISPKKRKRTNFNEYK